MILTFARDYAHMRKKISFVLLMVVVFEYINSKKGHNNECPSSSSHKILSIKVVVVG